MLFAIIAAWIAYRRANDTNRNGILWAVIAGVSFIGTQFLVAFGIGAFVGLGIALWGWPENTWNNYELLFTAIAVILSFIPTLLILRFLGTVPDEPAYSDPPPPPTKFENQDSGDPPSSTQ
jgi:MFS family permease